MAPTRLPIANICRAGSLLLTDGGIETRLIYEFGCELPDFASFLPLFRPAQRPALETIYRSYLDVARDSGLAMQLGRRDFNHFDLSYLYDRIIYADNTQFDANQHHINARLHFEKRRLTLDGSDNLDFLLFVSD